MFTDSCGREVELPANITKIAPSGTVATMILAAFVPEELVCVGTQVSENQVPYLYDGIADLPVTGQLYGGKATLNRRGGHHRPRRFQKVHCGRSDGASGADRSALRLH